MSWNDAKPILRAATEAGYEFLPIKDGDIYLITVRRARVILGVATALTWTEAATAAIGIVERDQARRAA